MLLDETPLVGSILDENFVWEELDSGLISPSQGISPQVICSDDDDSMVSISPPATTSPQAVNVAPESESAAVIPSIEAKFFCVD